MQKGSAAFFAALILLQSLLYGFGDPISKAAYETMSVYSLMTFRYGLAVAALLIFGQRRIRAGLRGVRLRVWLVPSLCIAAGYVLNNVALNMTTATSATFMRSLATILTPLLAFFLYRTRYRLLHLPLQLLVLFGLYLFCGGVAGFGRGEFVGILSALCLAASLVASGSALAQIDALTLTALQAMTSMVMAFICAFCFEGGLSLRGASPLNWAIIVYLALACTLLGYLLQNKALEGISSRTVALLQCLAPVLTALFSFLLLGETLDGRGLIGAAIIIFCVGAETFVDTHEEKS